MKGTLALGAGLTEQGVAGFCVYLGALSGTDPDFLASGTWCHNITFEDHC